jgi:hypothetical protein
MTLYRFYKVDKRGHVEGLPEAVECFDDTDAVEKAKKRANGRLIEIWDLARRVAVIEAHQKAGATKNKG